MSGAERRGRIFRVEYEPPGNELPVVLAARHPRDIDHARATGEAPQNLKANGIPVTLLGGQHYESGFTYRAWAPFARDKRDLIPDGDLTLELGWPGSPARRAPGTGHTRDIRPGRHPLAAKLNAR
jgi:hypothetical protein